MYLSFGSGMPSTLTLSNVKFSSNSAPVGGSVVVLAKDKETLGEKKLWEGLSTDDGYESDFVGFSMSEIASGGGTAKAYVLEGVEGTKEEEGGEKPKDENKTTIIIIVVVIVIVGVIVGIVMCQRKKSKVEPSSRTNGEEMGTYPSD